MVVHLTACLDLDMWSLIQSCHSTSAGDVTISAVAGAA